ncbi:MAG: hypothetical protein IPM48_08955 [Saprospiraceae bacterium]|nr:hypothetical protein [Saprospiraceae bacterium]
MKTILYFSLFLLLSKFTIAQVGAPQGGGTMGSSGFLISPQGSQLPYLPNSPSGPMGPSAPGGLQDRGVFWLHGLGGADDSWADAADATQHGGAPNFAIRGYKVNSHTTGLTYSEKSTLLLGAQDVRNYLDRVASTQKAEGVNPKYNFIVAHSQGGLVSQALMYKDFCFDPNISGPSYGGIVTFGSAHNGAMIINHAEKLKDWLKSGCNDLTDGPATEFTNGFVGKLLELIVDDEKLPYKKVVKEELCDKVINGLTKVSDILKPITADYGVQYNEGPLSTYKECIEDHANEISKVAFYGVEPPENLPWRTLDWMMLQDVNGVDKFQANSDDTLVSKVAKIKNYYTQKVLEKEFEIFELEFLHDMPCNWWDWITRPIPCAIYDGKYYKTIQEKVDYMKGVKWFDTADDKWAEIIGSLVIERKTSYFCECFDSNTGQDSYYEIKSPSECIKNPKPGKTCNVNDQYYFEKSYKPSDGIVLAESASEFPGANSLPVGSASREMVNSSHMQMRNDKNTRDKLTLLMNGDYGLFFSTPKR